LRWLTTYAQAGEGDRDATVGEILEAVNGLLLRSRTEDSSRAAEYETRLRVLTEQMPAILWSTDTELRVVSSTGGGRKNLIPQPPTFMAGALREIVGTDDPTSPPIAAHIRALQGTSAVYEYEWRERCFTVHIEPLRHADGTIVGTVGAALDITDRTRAEKERAAQRERQARLDGILFAVRELAARATTNLVASSEAVEVLQPQADLAPHLRGAIDAAAAALVEATGTLTELLRLIPSGEPTDSAARSRAGDQSAPVC
jgi:hypothetical protein